MYPQRALLSETVSTDLSVYAIRYSEPLGLVEVTSNGPAALSDLQAMLAHLLQVIEEKQPQYLLADTRKLNAPGCEGQKWISDIFIPSLSTSSVTKFARIVEPDVFTQAILESLLNAMPYEDMCGYSMQSFTDREKALEWIYN